MSDRESELRRLAADLRDREAVSDAFLARSFDDRLLIVDLRRGESVPEAVRERLEAHGLRGVNEVYGTDDGDRSFAGDIGDSTRHQFVDVRNRSESRPPVTY